MRLVRRDEAAVDKDFLVVWIFKEDLRPFQRSPVQPEHDFTNQERERRLAQERIPQSGNRVDDLPDSEVFRGDRSVNDTLDRVILNQIRLLVREDGLDPRDRIGFDKWIDPLAGKAERDEAEPLVNQQAFIAARWRNENDFPALRPQKFCKIQSKII